MRDVTKNHQQLIILCVKAFGSVCLVFALYWMDNGHRLMAIAIQSSFGDHPFNHTQTKQRMANKKVGIIKPRKSNISSHPTTFFGIFVFDRVFSVQFVTIIFHCVKNSKTENFSILADARISQKAFAEINDEKTTETNLVSSEPSFSFFICLLSHASFSPSSTILHNTCFSHCLSQMKHKN